MEPRRRRPSPRASSFSGTGKRKTAPSFAISETLRAQLLSNQYLGKGAPGNAIIFGPGGKPDAFLAVTAHTQETAAPSAESWGKQVTAFSVPPHDPNEEDDLSTQTQKAAAELNSAEHDGKIVVIVWEHKHIAKQDASNTFRTLLALGDIDAPKSWKGVNYDFFWIVDYAESKPKFTVIQQEYPGAVGAKVPNNPWGVEVDQTKFPDFYQDCEHKED